MKKTKIICTIGPSSYNPATLNKLKKEGVNIFRINMSHTKLSKLPNILKNLKKYVGKDKICIDTEGAQLRTTLVRKKVFIKKKKLLKFLTKITYQIKIIFTFTQNLIFYLHLRILKFL